MVVQIRNEDRATVSDLHHYDDGRLLSNYDFSCDLAANGFSGEDGLRKLAYRYRKITEFYKLGLERSSVSKYVPFWQDLWNKTDSCCKNWLSSVQNLLEATLASDQDVIHVIVTAGKKPAPGQFSARAPHPQGQPNLRFSYCSCVCPLCLITRYSPAPLWKQHEHLPKLFAKQMDFRWFQPRI